MTNSVFSHLKDKKSSKQATLEQNESTEPHIISQNYYY